MRLLRLIRPDNGSTIWRALSHGSRRVAELASLTGATAQVVLQRRALHNARNAAGHEAAARILDEQEQLIHQQARLSWAPAHDPQWLAKADLPQAGRAWASPAPVTPWHDPVPGHPALAAGTASPEQDPSPASEHARGSAAEPEPGPDDDRKAELRGRQIVARLQSGTRAAGRPELGADELAMVLEAS
jgi:hypothetical protein